MCTGLYSELVTLVTDVVVYTAFAYVVVVVVVVDVVVVVVVVVLLVPWEWCGVVFPWAAGPSRCRVEDFLGFTVVHRSGSRLFDVGLKNLVVIGWQKVATWVFVD